MIDVQARIPFGAAGPEPRFDASCQMCGRVAGQLVSGAFVHHPDCTRMPVFDSGLPRCCDCGGRLYFEQANSPLLSAAEREADRRIRPSTR